MNLFRAKLVTYIIAFGLIISACIGAGLYYIQPLFDWNWFVGIVIFFLAIESLVMYLIADKSQEKEKKQMVNLYMLTKVIKVIASLFFITVYVLSVKENVKSFVAVFILFYLLYLVVETILFVRIEKHLKEKNISNE